MDSDETCEVSASKKWLTLAALTCNWQLKLANFRKFHRCPWGSINCQYFVFDLLPLSRLACCAKFSSGRNEHAHTHTNSCNFHSNADSGY